VKALRIPISLPYVGKKTQTKTPRVWLIFNIKIRNFIIKLPRVPVPTGKLKALYTVIGIRSGYLSPCRKSVKKHKQKHLAFG